MGDRDSDAARASDAADGAASGAAASKGRTGGLYVPPAKLKAMMQGITDQTSKEYAARPSRPGPPCRPPLRSRAYAAPTSERAASCARRYP